MRRRSRSGRASWSTVLKVTVSVVGWLVVAAYLEVAVT
jgi:hypothetical protein